MSLTKNALWSSNFLKVNGLIELKSDKRIFKNRDHTLYLAIYVDDGIEFSKYNEKLDYLVENLEQKFEMTVSENPNKSLGIKIEQHTGKVRLSQENYIQTTLEKC